MPRDLLQRTRPPQRKPHWQPPPRPEPFRLIGPALISFSGGRTSAYMLWRILQAHGGTLPPDVVVCFANTGREMPATLQFVADCASHWQVPIHWLEYRRDPETGRVWTEEVGPNSASRNGEPFRQMIPAKRILPNATTRFCTTELKIRTIKRFVLERLRWPHWVNAVGLRADEPARVQTLLRNNEAARERWRTVAPLAEAGVDKAEVLAFWRAQPFDLGLRGAWEGNCDGCYLKRKAAILRMIQDHPERMAWWAEMEGDSGKALGLFPGRQKRDMLFFRIDRPSFAQMMALERDQLRLNLDLAPEDDGLEAMLAGSCEGGCGAG